MQHFIFFRIIFWIALLGSIIVIGLIFWMIDKLHAKIRLLKLKTDSYIETENILTGQDVRLDQLTT